MWLALAGRDGGGMVRNKSNVGCRFFSNLDNSAAGRRLVDDEPHPFIGERCAGCRVVGGNR